MHDKDFELRVYIIFFVKLKKKKVKRKLQIC